MRQASTCIEAEETIPSTRACKGARGCSVNADPVLKGMPLAHLIPLSRTEMEKYLRREPSDDTYAYELFRRAICEQQPLAWEALYTQYHDLLRCWARRHPAWHAYREGDEECIAAAFARLWSCIGPERFRTFSSAAPLLRYLKLCVHSVLLDDVRAQRAAYSAPVSDDGCGQIEPSDVATVSVGRMSEHALWEAISAEVKDEGEGLVARLCLVLEMKPREVAEQHPAVFTDVEDVYRVKRNLLERLQHSTAIRAFLP